MIGKKNSGIKVKGECYGILFVEEFPAHAFYWSHEEVMHLARLTTNLERICHACSWVDGPIFDTELVKAKYASAARIPVYDPSTKAWV